MDVEHRRDAARRIALVAAGEVPCDGGGCSCEHDAVALGELCAVEEPTERIGDVRVRASW